MAVSNSIFNNAKKENLMGLSNGRVGLDSFGKMDSDEASIFNTYKHWEPFAVPSQTIISNKKDANGAPVMEVTQNEGTKSLFNPFNAVYTYSEMREDANMPLLDNPQSRIRQRENNACTIKDLVEASENGLMGRQIYNYSDFAYCKYLGRIPNNYLITLRRFGAPCGDKIDRRNYISELEDSMQNHMPDMGRMVTWIGTPGNDMSNILKYSYSMRWKENKAEIQEEGIDSEQGTLASLFNMSSSKYRQQVMQGKAGSKYPGKDGVDAILGFGTKSGWGGSNEPPYKSSDWQKNYDNTKVYGPVDVIDKTQSRDRGLDFEQKFSLTFDYELRSYDGVNGKAAFIDLLGNILQVTYTLGTFWGGERRFIGNAQDNIFANLPIFKLADSGGLNNPSAVYNALLDSIQQGASAFSNAGGGGSALDQIKNLAKDLGGMLLGGALNKLGRPQKFALSSLLSPAPTGCWHLTIGNPKSPILEIGNLILKSASVEHYGPLGLDDFPTGLRVTVELEHGKPRDIMGIEQMYMRGDTRFYAPMGDRIMNMYNNADVIISKLHNEGTKQRNLIERLEKKQNKAGLTTQETSLLNNMQNVYTANLALTSVLNKHLVRYFGTSDSGNIVAASKEALYGSEKHKNDHVGANAQPADIES